MKFFEILILENDADHTSHILRTFTDNNLRQKVTVIREVEEGLEYIFRTGRHRENRDPLPGLILVDLSVSIGKREGILDVLRNYIRTREIPVIVLAPATSAEVTPTADSLPGTISLSKPLEFKDFKEAVGRLKPGFLSQ